MTRATGIRTEIYGDYAEILSADPPWTIGSFPLPGNRVWEMREPDAATIVRNNNLWVGVGELTRSHDRSQILDNAKHVVFSTRQFIIPEGGGISFELSMKVRRRGAIPDDLYDGYASLLCLDLSSGTALDFFLAEDLCAGVFARLPFPGVEPPDVGPLKYWAIFRERQLEPVADGFHRFKLEIEPQRGISWLADGVEIGRQPPLDYALGPLTLGLGIMTEKDIESTGSVSLHGQGVQAEWTPIEIATWNDSTGAGA